MVLNLTIHDLRSTVSNRILSQLDTKVLSISVIPDTDNTMKWKEPLIKFDIEANNDRTGFVSIFNKTMMRAMVSIPGLKYNRFT